MQKLWSRVLKQEIIIPGSTSLKALDTLKKNDPKGSANLSPSLHVNLPFW